MNILKKIDKNIYLFLGGAILILWQMLKPGYILTLDMVFTPKIKVIFSDGAFYNAAPVRYFLSFLNQFFDGWIVQKIVLLALFFCLGYLAYRFLPVPEKYYARYWAALFYAVNPFVYERFLAGHWTHLFAYAFFPPLICYLIKLGQDRKIKDGLLFLLWLFLIGIFSLHFLIMAILIAGFYLGYVILANIFTDRKKALTLIKLLILGGLLFAVASSDWLTPYLSHREQSVLNTFSAGNWEAFKTASDARLGTTLNVLTLYGFWGESQSWARYFLWPKDNFVFWLLISVFLFSIIGLGLYRGLKDKASRSNSIFILILAIFAFIFSCGIGETIFKGLNLWLFTHIGFWSGFRDTQKFSAWLAFGYAYFGAFGLILVGEYLEKIKFKFSRQVLAVILIMPILYTYTMIGGFARQLQPVWYPADWQKVNEILNQDQDNAKALFLPWHMYLSLDFNHNLVSINPARSYFDQDIIQGDNMEIGGIFSQTSNKENMAVQQAILAENADPDATLDSLLAKGIKYVIVYQTGVANDYLRYDWLKSARLKAVSTGSLTLLRINVK